MDFFETLQKRHSVRTFTGKSVSDDVIRQILQGALTAPSSKNCHSTSFIVVNNPHTLRQISKMREMGSALIADSQVTIIVCGDPDLSDVWVDNAAISATILQLAVVAEDLGSCWVHINERKYNSTSDTLASDYLRSIVNIPDNLHPLCAIAIGHPKPDYKFVTRTNLYNDKVIEL